MAAVLHDTIEDTKTTPGELDEHFGRTVRKVVEKMTDDKTLDKAVRKARQVEHAALAPREGDQRDVMENPPSDWSLARRIEYLDWTEKVVAGCRGTNAALEKLYDQLLEKGKAELAAPAPRRRDL